MTFGQLIRKFWIQILVFGGAFVALTVMTLLDLNALEAREVESVRLWAPIVSFYERFGYWPAVLFVPALGLVCGGFIGWKLMKDGRLRP